MRGRESVKEGKEKVTTEDSSPARAELCPFSIIYIFTRGSFLSSSTRQSTNSLRPSISRINPSSSHLLLELPLGPPSSPSFLQIIPTKEAKKNLMGSKAPNWADQWGAGGFGSEEENEHMKKQSGRSSGKMAEAKAKASAGMDKAKAAAMVGADKAKEAAVVGAMKLKSGTSAGLKWVKNQYSKRTSSSK